jgi:hypothetical protein
MPFDRYIPSSPTGDSFAEPFEVFVLDLLDILLFCSVAKCTVGGGCFSVLEGSCDCKEESGG